MSKALLIKSYTTITTGTPGQWDALTMASSYIQGIQTGKILDDVSADKIAALISGVPTPWARAKLFKFAFDTLANPDPNIGATGLTQYYGLLLGEWRGLIALLALHSDRIRFSAPVVMDTRGSDYSLAAAFGRMLFADRDLWSNQDALAKDPDAQPYLHLIYYKGQLVGGTSPLTGVFTAVNYSRLDGAGDIAWYRNGKLEDPLPYLSPVERQKLYLFVRNMNVNLDAFERKVNACRGQKAPMALNGLKAVSRKWEAEIQRSSGGTLRDKGPIATYPALACPYSLLFENSVPVYLKRDFTFTYLDGTGFRKIGDIQQLLSTGHNVVGWAEDTSARRKLADAPVFFLSVSNLATGAASYFSLPLSELGIDIFRNNLSALLGYNADGQSHSRLTATISPDGSMLAVDMTVEIDGQSVALNTREYAIDWLQSLGHVIVWPNFTSEVWNKYYLYSEFTPDSRERFLPIFRDNETIVRDPLGHFLTPAYSPAPGEMPGVTVNNLATYPAGQGDDLPRYDILSADKPIEGLHCLVKRDGREEGAGYLMVRHSEVNDLSGTAPTMTAVVGIDFGSNNTCVYYNADDRGAKPVNFDDHRVVLVGRENDDLYANAAADELLFFTNYPAPHGQLKSWLHEHDARYIGFNQAEEVAGGVPVNRPNVVVRKMDEFVIQTQVGTLHYNMKWLDDDKGLQKKRAFLKSVWLQVCASLFVSRIRPEKIRWAHPGSMMDPDITEYGKIYADLASITPITMGKRPTLAPEQPTEAEAVCSYALSQDFGLTPSNIFLGVDVGGSTSDILLLGRDPSAGGHAALLGESSVRLAAGVFYKAITGSETFRRALVAYHESRQRTVYVSNIRDILTHPEKAPYFLNNIFDQLHSAADYATFYETIDREAKFAFTIPAYVTGLLLFYSGQLIGKTLRERGLTQVGRVDILPFGKGGRIFHWLRHSAGERLTSEYYAACLNAGVESLGGHALEVRYRAEIEAATKAEVARGLCDPKELSVPADIGKADICGEAGVRFVTPSGDIRDIAVGDKISGEHFADRMNNFEFTEASCFTAFMRLFTDFVGRKTKLYRQAESELATEIADVPQRIVSYITNNDREYSKAVKAALSGEKFSYHQPIIIAEGLCFLDTLIRKAFNQ